MSSKNILANSALNAASGLAQLLTGFACSIVAARLLGPAANGTIAFSQMLVTKGSLIAELGTGVMLLRILPQLTVQGVSEKDRRGFAAYLQVPVVVATLLLAAAYFFVVGRLDEDHWLDMTPMVATLTGVLFIIQSIGSYSKNYLIGEQRLGPFFQITVIAALMQLVGVVIGAVVFKSIEAALIGYLLGQIAPFIYSVRIFLTRANPCGMHRRTLAASSFLLSLEYVITSIFLTRLEILFLQRFFDKENVGFYAVALTLANLALQLPVQLTGSLMPYYSEKLEASGQGRLPIDMFAVVVRSLAYITLPMSFGLAAISQELVTSVFGPEFTPAGMIVAILALATPVFVFSQLCTQYLFSQGQIKIRLLVDFIGSAIIVGGCILLVPLYGGPGAAVVRALSFVAMCLFMASAMEFDGSIGHVFRTLLPVTLAAMVCGLVAEANILLFGGLVGLILAIPAGALAYILALRLFKAVPESDVDALMKLADRFPGKLKRGLIAIVHFVAPHARRAVA